MAINIIVAVLPEHKERIIPLDEIALVKVNSVPKVNIGPMNKNTRGQPKPLFPIERGFPA